MSGRRIRWESAGRMAAIGVAVIAVVLALPALLRTEPPPPPPDVGLVQAPPPVPPPAPTITPPPKPPKPAKGAKREKGAGHRAAPKPEPAQKRPGRTSVEDPSPGAEDGSETEVSAAIPPPVVYVPPPPSRERFGFER